jgi:hypothetical protein
VRHFPVVYPFHFINDLGVNKRDHGITSAEGEKPDLEEFYKEQQYVFHDFSLFLLGVFDNL